MKNYSFKQIVVAVVLSAFSFNSAYVNAQHAQSSYTMLDLAVVTASASVSQGAYLMFDGKFPIKDSDSMAKYLRSKGYKEGESLNRPFFEGPVYGFRNCRIDFVPKRSFDEIKLKYVEQSLSLFVTMARGIKDIGTAVDFYHRVVNAVKRVEGNPDEEVDQIVGDYGSTNEDYLLAFSEGDACVETSFVRSGGEICVEITVDDITNTYEVILLYRQVE